MPVEPTKSTPQESSAVASVDANGTSNAQMLTIVAAFCCLVVALQQTLVIPAVPQFPTLLDSTPEMVSWLVTATLLAGAVATPIFGRLSDLVGKRRMMFISMLFVIVVSLVSCLGCLVIVSVDHALYC